MQITVWKNFVKKFNSTKRPGANTGTNIDVVLKSGTSRENPIFLIDGIDLDVNYVGWYDHYYFVTDIVLGNNNIYEIHCAQDVLATFKGTIGATSAYILRSAGDSNGEINDAMYPITSEVTIESRTFNQLIPETSGTYIMGVVGQGSNTLRQGSVSYYAMDNFSINAFRVKLFSEDFWKSLLTDIQNPLDYVVSCYWVPIDLFTGRDRTDVVIGRFDMEFSAYKLTTSDRELALQEKSVAIPKHPQSATRGNFLNENPYSAYEFVYSGFGTIPLATNKLLGDATLYAKVVLDVVTGQSILELRTESHLVTRETSQLGVPVALSQNTIPIGSILGAASSVVGAVASGIIGNAAGAIAGGISAIDSAVDAMRGSNHVTGTNGSFLGFYGDAQLFGIFKNIADEDNTHKGRPLCEVRTISSLSGYILCSDASVNLAGTQGDKDAVNSLLNSGFYYE